MNSEVVTLPYAIVEDIPDVADRLRLEMEQYPGWVCVGNASSVRQARQLLDAHRPALLFCDWDLVGGSGFEVLQHVAAMSDYNPYLVFNTGFQADHPEIAEALVNIYRPDTFINKPYWKKLKEQLPAILTEARLKSQSAQAKPDHVWVHTFEGQRIKINRASIICIVQDAVYPRCKRIYTVSDTEGILCQLNWKEAEDILAEGGIDFFVTNKRQSIICREFLKEVDGVYAYLQHMPFKVEVVKEYLKAFYAWAGIKRSNGI
jgi:DNA-binding LytR/AlgR family response regulator